MGSCLVTFQRDKTPRFHGDDSFLTVVTTRAPNYGTSTNIKTTPTDLRSNRTPQKAELRNHPPQTPLRLPTNMSCLSPPDMSPQLSPKPTPSWQGIISIGNNSPQFRGTDCLRPLCEDSLAASAETRCLAFGELPRPRTCLPTTRKSANLVAIWLINSGLSPVSPFVRT